MAPQLFRMPLGSRPNIFLASELSRTVVDFCKASDITEAWVASYSLTEPGDLDPWAVVMHAEKAAVAEKLMLSVNIRASRPLDPSPGSRWEPAGSPGSLAASTWE
ncbi:hypothetical protein AK812_SmicGene14415 [Symbiodinium microadriaticum]|uniref:Uncharacterized protein n=1 Tax=Symbiodinium microadriaticum TaxID=2951 RepID=A0A1Q9E5L7_SYMMI|nr:hypothetical protein AK812_SmicGene14415 [Symbiodinium microadriaticum]